MDRDHPFVPLHLQAAYGTAPSSAHDACTTKLQLALKSIQAACVVYYCDLQNAETLISGNYASHHFHRLLKSVEGRVNLPMLQMMEWVRNELEHNSASPYNEGSRRYMLLDVLEIAQKSHRALNVYIRHLIVKAKAAGCRIGISFFILGTTFTLDSGPHFDLCPEAFKLLGLLRKAWSEIC